jgi:Concanavalin A-like lectin/glucanases superfamily
MSAVVGVSLVLGVTPFLSSNFRTALADQFAPYEATILGDNPEAYWPFDPNQPAPFYAGTDISGHNQPIGATAPVADSPFGGGDTSERTPPAFQLNAAAALPEQQDNFTLEFWLKPDTVRPAIRTAFLDIGFQSAFNFFFGMVLSIDTNGELLLSGHGGSDDFLADSGFSFPNSGQWYHVVISVGPNSGFGGAPTTVYVNGQQTSGTIYGPLSMGSADGTSTNNQVLVGQEGPTPDGVPHYANYSGEIDDLAYYLYALSGKQAQALCCGSGGTRHRAADNCRDRAGSD